MPDFDSQFPINLSERPLRFGETEIDPAKSACNHLSQTLRQHREMSDNLLVRLAQTRYQLARLRQDVEASGPQVDTRSLVDALEIIGESIQDVLDERAVRAADLTDQPWNAEMRAEVDVRGQEIREDIDHPRVAFMELPVVHRGDRLIAKGAAVIEAPKRD